MNNLNETYYNKPFSHIYIEESAASHAVTQNILSHFPNATKIPIRHYKDVFNRSHQDFVSQKKCPSLILATKKEHMVYPGAKVCQSFGNEHFYYCSNIMNCLFDCEYCYLQGMYPSGHIVIFVNLEDIFSEVTNLLKQHPVYLCISYDTDLMALEWMTGFLHKWNDFITENNKQATDTANNTTSNSTHHLTVEIRTKSQAIESIHDILGNPDIIFAWTLSPKRIADQYEHGSASFEKRLFAANEAMKYGSPVRLCFDPMLDCPNFEQTYHELFTTTFSQINPEKIFDVSIGTFRISKEYLKKMRQNRRCEITAYPYSTNQGVSGYDMEKETAMINFAMKELMNYFPKEKIFRWNL